MTRLIAMAAGAALLLAACGGVAPESDERLTEPDAPAEVAPASEEDEIIDDDPSDQGDAGSGEFREAILTYTVGGDASVSGREVALHICSSDSSEGFVLDSIADVVFRLAAEGGGPGQREASIDLLPPPEFRGDRVHEPVRALGSGTVSFENEGPDPVMGWDWISGSFSAQGLTSSLGHTFSLEGTFTCPLLTSG